MVYNFSLPPLTAHAILTGSSHILSDWAASLKAPSQQTTFFNFTASHDGIGVRPVTGILNDDDLEVLLRHTVKGGGAVSSKTNPDGTSSPYELNITYYDLLNSGRPADSQDLQVQRFLVSQAIMLELAGVPGIYMHSLLGSRNYAEGVRLTGQSRTINREKLEAQSVEQALDDPSTLRHAVFNGYRALLEVRTQERAFHPIGRQTILEGGENAFAVLRQSPDGTESLLALNNITAEQVTVEIDIPYIQGTRLAWVDLLTGTTHESAGGQLKATLVPYQTIWAKSGFAATSNT
jgi:sucrose phosphorylase